MSQKNDDYRSDQDDKSQSSIDSIEDLPDSSESEQFKQSKSKKLLKKQKNQKKTRLNKQKFIDTEASETSDNESDDNSVGEITKGKQEQMYNELALKRKHHRDVVKQIEERYQDGDQDIQIGDDVDKSEDEIEKPGLRDPKFWRVSCNKGKEQEAVTSIMFKHNHLIDTNPLEIVSVFALKKFPAAIFIEANFEQHVMRAIEGLTIVRQCPPELVESEQCPNMFKPAEVEQIDIEEGQWVRVRQHNIYSGDLARVMQVDQERKLIKLKVVPRQKLLMKSLEEEEENKKKNSKKNNANADQSRFQMKEEEGEPPIEDNEPFQRGSKFKFLKRAKYLQEQRKYIRGPKIPIQMTKKSINDDNDEPTSQFFYTTIRDEWTSAKKDGFEIITLPVHQVLTGNIKPTVEDLQYFYPDVQDYRLILQKLHSSLKQVVEQKSQIQIGDYITLTHDQAKSSRYKVSQILQDENKLIISKTVKNKNNNEKRNYEYKLDISEAKLAFKLYQQVSIVSGPNTGLSGTIIKMDDLTAQISTEAGRIVDALISDLQSQKNVIKKMDIEENPDAGAGQQKPGFKRNDLVKFGLIDNDIGCILNISNNEVSVLDLTNQIKNINKLAIRNSINTRNNVVKNMYGNDIRQQDLVVILDGFYKNNKATVLHVYRDYLFLFNGKFDNTQGVIIEKANNCGLVSSSKKPDPGANTISQMPNEDWKNLRGQMVTIRKGQWQSYRGMVQEVTSRVATIQLSAKNLVVKVPLECIKSESSNSHLQVGKTPQHHPGMSTRVWDDLEGVQQSAMRGGYQSPYITYQTPMRND
ncbi:unnamed protein product (macronuclear) [Paramecium tetraurelia]|uniref:KOW domain-containing protein n=1 Tax=Paramecium tetraurelia TaxID=5888 RepID=A0D4Q4_PARTE|nr:uncharacterized protein GSPATT00013468001 [Paramecium tetraurelia]CAK78021.1 unnamed protein product [Paramecium tetraurelia]|eukprot:XP_001445418.1 hypothetical protein (macronuclear) [Paramecium tetraurelia strain d4-2]